MPGRTFILRVCAIEGIDVIRNLRGWLKVGLRRFGLRVIAIEEEEQTNKPRGSFGAGATRSQERRKKGKQP
jgi:hypothetical protein